MLLPTRTSRVTWKKACCCPDKLVSGGRPRPPEAAGDHGPPDRLWKSLRLKDYKQIRSFGYQAQEIRDFQYFKRLERPDCRISGDWCGPWVACGTGRARAPALHQAIRGLKWGDCRGWGRNR